MTSDRNGLLKNASNGTISSAGPSEIIVSESLDDTIPSELNEFGDCGTLKRLIKKSADIRSKFKGVSSCKFHQSGLPCIFVVSSLFGDTFSLVLRFCVVGISYICID